jgi:hypothetical protein
MFWLTLILPSDVLAVVAVEIAGVADGVSASSHHHI